MGHKKGKEPASSPLAIAKFHTAQTIAESEKFMDSARENIRVFKALRDELAKLGLDTAKIAYYDAAIKRLETQLDNHEGHIDQLKDSIDNESAAPILGSDGGEASVD